MTFRPIALAAAILSLGALPTLAAAAHGYEDVSYPDTGVRWIAGADSSAIVGSDARFPGPHAVIVKSGPLAAIAEKGFARPATRDDSGRGLGRHAPVVRE